MAASIARFQAFFLILSGCVFFSQAASAKSPDLRSAILPAGELLRSLVLPSGRVIYEMDAVSGKPIGNDYNFVRHAGAIYALSQFERTYPDPATRDAILRASRYLVANAVKPVHIGNRATFAVFSDYGKIAMAPLGGSALAVVALLGAERIRPGTTPRGRIEGLGRFLLQMQQRDGSFKSLYSPDPVVNRFGFESLYFPGEAMLALVRLYQWDHDRAYLDAAVRGMEFLAKTRLASGSYPPDAWAMVASAELWKIRKDWKSSDQPLFIGHALGIARAIREGQTLDRGKGALYGSYTPDGRTTPTAARLEGMIAALRVIPASHSKERKKLGASAQAAVEFLASCQIRQGKTRGAWGGLAVQPREIRVDYVQHALSSLLAYCHLRHACAR